MNLRDVGVIKKEPTMSDTLSKLKHTLEKDIGKAAAREYAQPRHREEHLPVATSPWQGDALSSVQTTILRMTYGEMMDFSKGLVASLHHQDKEIDEGTMAKGIHHWAVNYKETER